MNVLVTGGSRGIGAACVRAFAAGGHAVTFLYAQNEAAAALVAADTGATAIRADVGDRDQLFAAVDKVGPVDALVCCAGVAHCGLFQDMSEADLRRLMDVNALGSFFAAQAVAPSMISRRSGSIVFVSSMWGQVGASCEAAYSMSKGAQIALTKALAKELGPSGVRVNCVAPGLIATDMNASLDALSLDSIIDETPLGRVGLPADVARAVLYLASDSAGFITGAVLPVNGGLVI